MLHVHQEELAQYRGDLRLEQTSEIVPVGSWSQVHLQHSLHAIGYYAERGQQLASSAIKASQLSVFCLVQWALQVPEMHTQRYCGSFHSVGFCFTEIID